MLIGGNVPDEVNCIALDRFITRFLRRGERLYYTLHLRLVESTYYNQRLGLRKYATTPTYRCACLDHINISQHVVTILLCHRRNHANSPQTYVLWYSISCLISERRFGILLSLDVCAYI